jgi:hypothetical protein
VIAEGNALFDVNVGVDLAVTPNLAFVQVNVIMHNRAFTYLRYFDD